MGCDTSNDHRGAVVEAAPVTANAPALDSGGMDEPNRHVHKISSVNQTVPNLARQRIKDLEEALAHNQENLLVTVEELETTNKGGNVNLLVY